MAEEAVATETTPTTETTSTQTAAVSETPPPSFINADGTFKEGWQQNLLPEEYRTDTQYNGIKDVKGLFDRTHHLQARLTQSGKGIVPITDKSTPQAIQEYRAAMGIPDKPEGYTLNVPAEAKAFYPADNDPGFIEARAMAHKLNLTPTQFAGVMAQYAKTIQQGTQLMDADPIKFYNQALEKAQPVLKQKAEQTLKAKWGDAFEARLNLANQAIEENTKSPEEKAALLNIIGNSPEIADFLATVYHKHFTESHGVDTSLGHGTKSLNLDQRIAEITGKLTDELKRNNRTEYDKLIAEKETLYRQKYPEKQP